MKSYMQTNEEGVPTMRPLTRTVMLALLLYAGVVQTTAQQAQTSAADTPAARRVQEFIPLINSGDRTAARKYIIEN